MSEKSKIESDAAGQFAPSQADRKASGVASAKPTVITGSEDGTAHKIPPGQKAPAKKRPVRYDATERNKS